MDVVQSAEALEVWMWCNQQRHLTCGCDSCVVVYCTVNRGALRADVINVLFYVCSVWM